MNHKLLSVIVCMLLLWTGCADQPHFITDKAVRSQVEKDFQVRQDALPYGNLFEVFNEPMSPVEQEALSFLYAYMPIGDITDYSGDFYLQNIRSSFRAREEMPWGDSIPEGIFRHFVLPVRVNNENMDNSRLVFYEELKDRVGGMSLADAVLEVNHWCHEKVIYTPSDSRTSSPLASVKTAYGRCGEESVFTVAALRSVGIPARQVYTPRWAHTDDNHAWVEAWVNGKWYFIGACEPEPVLNMAWFNEPVARGMLMHSKAFGRYNGPEEIMETTGCYTEINVTDNYAPTALATISVTDTNGAAVEDATVEFKIYNYAEFNTVARKRTDKQGKASLSAGKGDMLVWASKDGRFGYQKVSFGKDSQVGIVLDKKPGDAISLDLDIVPPVPGRIPIEVTQEQKEANARRLLEEDEIRNRYVSTFCTEEKAKALAEEWGTDPQRTPRYLLASRGNWKEISEFLASVPKEQRPVAMDLLGAISEKDLRDTPASVLLDHLLNTPAYDNKFFATAYLLNPRVRNELLTPYRSFFSGAFDEQTVEHFRQNPQSLVEWVKQNITVNNDLNPQRIPVMPIGVWKALTADVHSRNIFFISVARSLHIPARIESVTGKVQYVENEQWIDVDFEASAPVTLQQGKIRATYNPIKALDDPKYYSHFTIAKILSDGTLQTLNFRSGSADLGVGNTWSSLLKKPMPLDEGDYLLVTGTRMAKGNVMARIGSFSIAPEKDAAISLVMRENTDDIQVIGSVDAEAKFDLANGGGETSILSTTGRGYFIVGILGPRQEPTNHAMRDIAAVSKELETWGRSMILLFKNEKDWKNFDTKEFGTLPSTITYGIDKDQGITNMVAGAMHLHNKNSLPIFIIADTFGRVVFVSQGYTIGLGEQLMNVINKI